jgi:quinol monooxygenase YgiN
VVIVIARFRPRPDRRDDLVALLEEVQAASRLDDGCLHYGYYTEITDPLSFIAVEEWRDNEALGAPASAACRPLDRRAARTGRRRA